jgi:sugar lactone lactonase YvrE
MITQQSLSPETLAESLSVRISSSIRRFSGARAGVILLCSLALLAASLPALAQSVSFAGLQIGVGSGLSSAHGIAVDGGGDVFIAQNGAGGIVKIPAGCTSGACQVSIGSGLSGPFGVAVDISGDVFVADTGNSRVVEIPAGCTSSSCQVAIGSGLNAPEGVTVDGAGDVFIADTGNARVVEVPAGGGSQFTVGTGFSKPIGVAVDRAGDVFVGDFSAGQVVEVPAGCTTGSCQVAVGSGLVNPAGIALDAGGDLFIADTGNVRVVEVPAGGGAQTTVGGGLSSPFDVAVDQSGDVFIADAASSHAFDVERYGVNSGSVNVGSSSSLTLTYNITASIALGSTTNVLTQGAPKLDFTLGSTTCTGSQSAGNTCLVVLKFAPRVAGLRLGAVQVLDSTGNIQATTLARGAGLAPQIDFISSTTPQITLGSGFNTPVDSKVDAAGDVFIADNGNGRVVEIPVGGGAPFTVGSGLLNPSSVWVDGAGDVFIADTSNNRVVEVPSGCSSSACQITVVSGLNNPEGVLVDGAGNIYIGDTHNDRVVEIPVGCSSSACQTILASGLSHPGNVAIDALGNLFITDFNNNRIVELPAGCTGGTCQISVGAGLNGPGGVAVNGADNIFIADYGDNRALEIPFGCTTTACEIGIGSGMNSPVGMGLDGVGNVFVADTENNRVLEFVRSLAPSLTFASTPQGSTSVAQTVTIENVGNVALAFSSFAASTNFGVDLATTTCSTSSALASGQSCNVGVVCSPNGTGNLNGTLTLTDDALNVATATQAIALSCTGTVGTIAPTITSANNATFIVGTLSSFSVTTTGSPTPSITESGALPNGVGFINNGNGTATISGTPTTGGTFGITITAANGNSPNAIQSFTLTVNQAPAITSANNATFSVGAAGSFTVTTSGIPTASLSESGALPNGVTLVDNHNGTGTLGGTPTAGGTFGITITAANGISPNAIQSLTLTVNQAPAITSANNATFSAGGAGSFTVTTTGIPTASLSASGALPSGVTFVDNHNGTGALSGTPGSGTGGTYKITFSATNGIGSAATQAFTLTVNSSGNTTVGLSSYYNVYGVATVGNAPKNGGFDNDSYAYNSSLLGSSLTYQSLAFSLGSANAPDAVYGQTIALPAGSHGQLFLLGAGVNGNQTNQNIVVTYTDGSTSTLTQSFSDWCSPQNYSGETLVIASSNRISSNGQTQTIACNLYGYTFALNASKTAASVKLPANRNVVFLAMGLGTSTGTPITPYIQVNGGAWQTTNSVTVGAGSSVNLGPQPLTGGSWSWAGPHGYTSTSRQINNIPLSSGANAYVATYTNASGAISTATFTITVAGWVEIGNNIDSIACASDGTLVVASGQNQSVFEYLSGTWTELPGQMVHVAAVSKSSIWGIGLNGNVYHLNGNSWTQVGVNASYIAAGSDGTVLIVNARDGSIWKYVSGSNWTQVPGGYASVISVVANNNYFAVNNGKVYQYNGNWSQIGTGAAYIRAASDGTVLATTNSGQIYQYVSPNNWTQISGSMQIAAPVKASVFFGMGLDNNVYSYGAH